MPRPRAGQLNRTITFTVPNTVADDAGGFDAVPETVATLAARVEGLDGRESMMAQALEGISAFRITTRWNADVLAQGIKLSATLDDGRELNVRSVTDPEGRRRSLTIMADTGSIGGES